jgi:hypothetical protein
MKYPARTAFLRGGLIGGISGVLSVLVGNALGIPGFSSETGEVSVSIEQPIDSRLHTTLGNSLLMRA